MNDYLSNLVKCFNNSNLGVNLTTILIDNEPWFIAKEVASILKYTNLKKAINRNVNEADQSMLSYEECKGLFGIYSQLMRLLKTQRVLMEKKISRVAKRYP